MNVQAYIQSPSRNGNDHLTEKYGILAFAASLGIENVIFSHESVHDQHHGEKPVLSGLIADMEKNSVFVVTGFSRLGSSTAEVLDVLAKLSERGVMVYVLDGGFRVDNNYRAQVVASACSLVSLIEQELARSSRTTPVSVQDDGADPAAITPAPRTRRSILDGQEDFIRSLLSDSVPLAQISRRLGGVNRQTLKDFVISRNLM